MLPYCRLMSKFSNILYQPPRIFKRLTHKRLVCPGDLSCVRANENWDGSWRRIERPEYSNDELLDMVSKFPQIYDRIPEDQQLLKTNSPSLLPKRLDPLVSFAERGL